MRKPNRLFVRPIKPCFFFRDMMVFPKDIPSYAIETVKTLHIQYIGEKTLFNVYEPVEAVGTQKGIAR
jgi:hypothetical protein